MCARVLLMRLGLFSSLQILGPPFSFSVHAGNKRQQEDDIHDDDDGMMGP
jgi:hypothetical protein